MVHDRERMPRFYGSLDQRVWTMGELEGRNGLLGKFERDFVRELIVGKMVVDRQT